MKQEMPVNIDPRTGKPKIILSLCGGTGSWERPYKEAGYDTRNITLPEYDVLTYEPPENVYGILAAPPCTEFSLAKNGSHRKRNLSDGMNVVEACFKIIWKCRLQNNFQFWALENPIGYLRQFIGKPPYTDTHIPYLTVFERPNDPYFVKQYKSGKKNQFAWSAPKAPAWHDGPPLDRAALRAITPPGFAQAFYKANR